MIVSWFGDGALGSGIPNSLMCDVTNCGNANHVNSGAAWRIFDQVGFVGVLPSATALLSCKWATSSKSLDGSKNI